MDLMERIAWLLEIEQTNRYREAGCPDSDVFFQDYEECEIFNAIQDCRAQSTTFHPDNLR